MRIRPFQIEDWMNDHEDFARYNLAETCVNSISLDQLFDLTGTDRDAFLNALTARRLTYGAIDGSDDFRKNICSLYGTIVPKDIRTTHGAAGANHLVFDSLISPGDRVICVHPTYQQLYSIPESYGATVELIKLDKEDSYQYNTERLRELAMKGVRMICINNPNNPTGALMTNAQLEEIVAIAKEADAILLCDEVYRNLTQDNLNMLSVADLYPKGISVCSMSKAFSVAGLRLGWIACRDADIMEQISSHRDYSHISCGMLDEAVSALVLQHADKVLSRNRQIVRENLAVLQRFIEEQSTLSWVKPKAGTTTLLHYSFSMYSYEFCEKLLRDTGVLLSPGICFDIENCLRIGYACSRQELEEGLALLGHFLENI